MKDLGPLWQIEQQLEALIDSLDTCPDELRPMLETRISDRWSKNGAKEIHDDKARHGSRATVRQYTARR